AKARDDVMASWAWAQLLTTLGQLGKPSDAVAVLPAARAAMLRAGSAPELRVDFLYAESGVLFGDHHANEAHAALDDARAILEASNGPAKLPRLADIAFQDGTLDGMAGVPDRAEPLFRRAIALYTDAYGHDHPEVAH